MALFRSFYEEMRLMAREGVPAEVLARTTTAASRFWVTCGTR